MSSDDEDYMSEKFLQECIKDVRPGLIKNRIKQRKIEIEAKRARHHEEQKLKTQMNSQQNRLEAALKNPISTENKGFAMLVKMGYKQGEALGKNSKGIVEPIGINLKSDRSGLGRQAAFKEIEKIKLEYHKKKLERKENCIEMTTEAFRKRMTEKAEEKSIQIALHKCQRACERLDENDNVLKPVASWFWPKREEEKNEDACDNSSNDESDDEELQSDVKLNILCGYLRGTYYYCHWCGVQYENCNDLEKNCPGPDKDDH